MRRGDIVILDVPFSDRTGSKVRPALVVQDDDLNQRLADTIVALVTSSRRRFAGSASQLPIDPATPEGRQSGLRARSVVQCENLATVDKSFILGTLGHLSGGVMLQIDRCLTFALGIKACQPPGRT
jgi:mRNA interferase MazF